MNPNFHFFDNSDDLIPNVNPKDKKNPKPIPQDHDDDLDDYDDSCPKCSESLSKHTWDKKIQCALARVRGG